MSIIFITGNNNKYEEAKLFLPNLLRADIDLPEIQEIDPKLIIKHKLEEALKHHDQSFVVEDTSLYLDCLSGLPGPLIKWFMQTIGNEGIYDIAKKYDNYKAQAKTIVGYVSLSKEIHFFEGSIDGEIVYPDTEKSFGWDPIFKPSGYELSFGDMPKAEKNEISMRSQAFKKLADFLKSNNIEM